MPDRYAEKRSILPTSYVDFIEVNNGWEGALGEHSDFNIIILWDKETIQERWDAYEMAQYVSDYWFPFGSNGGGEMLCFNLNLGRDPVFSIPCIGMSGCEAMLKWDSFGVVARIIREKQAG